MKKKWLGLLLLTGLCLGTAMTAHAETYRGDDDWQVVFTAGAKMESNFRTRDLDDRLRELQPGDNAIFEVKLKNSHTATTDWYMTNKVISSLEDGIGRRLHLYPDLHG